MQKSQRENAEIQRKWFTIGVAISLSAATFASPIGSDMEQPWRAHGKEIKIDYQYGFNSEKPIKQSSETSKMPWTGAWWWTQSGSVAVRYHTALYWNKDHTAKLWPTWEETDAFTYDLYSAEQLSKMTAEEIRVALSPIEKLDVVSGYADPSHGGYYKNLAEVRGWAKGAVEANLDQTAFHGLCHGYSHAAIQLPEPDAATISVRYTLPSGKVVKIAVPFDSGDFKALATYYYGRRTKQSLGNQAGFIGANGQGMNPAALHLLLTNLVRDHDQGFVVDLGEGKPVWNYPVSGYEFTTNSSAAITDSAADPRAVKQVFVQTDLFYMGTSNPSQTMWGERSRERETSKRISYYLELDSSDRIVGGRWAGSSSRTDFAWSLKGQIPFEGDYAVIAPYFK